MTRLLVQPIGIDEYPPGQGSEPVAVTKRRLQQYLKNHLDPALRKCKQVGAYASIDFHRHRNVQWDKPDRDEEVRMFWEIVADRYGGCPHGFFELYNDLRSPISDVEAGL